ncbi:MAG TPA: CAP domain-containing protein [Anaeromyxobacter sp.]
MAGTRKLVTFLALAASALAAPRLAGAASAPEGNFTPRKPPAANYGPDPGKKCDMSILGDVLSDIAEAAKRAHRPVAEADGRLCAIAEELLAWPSGQSPRPEVLEFLSHWFGLPASVGYPAVIADFDIPDEREIATRVAQSGAGTAALNATHPRIGMAVQKTRRGRYDTTTKIAVVVLDAPVELQPVPRALAKGQTATLSGKLVAGGTKPRVYVADPSGKLASSEPESGEAFQVPVACGDKPGQILVEIRGEVNGGGAQIASFPIACGEPPPKAIAVAAEAWPTDQAAAEKKVLDGINADRAAAGLAPVKWDDGVGRVARSISDELARSGGVPGSSSLVDRLKKEGIGSPLVLQSAAAERTFARAAERIEKSPRDRATLLNPEANSGGVGLVEAKDAQGRPIVYVTEILIKELPPVDLAAVRQKLRDEIERKRRDARINSLKPDATLDGVAEKFAQALAAGGGTLPKEQASALTAPLNKSFKTVTMLSGAKQDPMDFAEEPQTTVPGKALGVGVAQGRHPALGRNAVYVTIMVGTPRAGAAEETSAAPAKKKKAGPSKK